LNGHSQSRVWLKHADLERGPKLELQMGNTPNKSLGADSSDWPPSAMAVDPASFETP